MNAGFTNISALKREERERREFGNNKYLVHMRVRPSSDHLLKSTHFAAVSSFLYLNTFNIAEILQNVSKPKETEMIL